MSKRKNRERFHCFYCGIIVRRNRSIDHIKPKCTGGALLGAKNKIASCKRCNREKAWRNLEEYRDFLTKKTNSDHPIMFFGEQKGTVIIQGHSFMYIPEVIHPKRIYKE